jgi:hypothetical protein
MIQIIASQLKKNIIIDCYQNDLKSIIMKIVPVHLKEMKLILGNDTICHWKKFEPNINLLEQWLYDKTQVIPVSHARALHLIISFIYHNTDDPALCVKKINYESIPEITDEECTIYNERNDRYETGKRVIYNHKETLVTEFYSPELIIETVAPILNDNNYYTMKLWQRITIKYTKEQMERISNVFEMKLEKGGDVMELYNNYPNTFIDILVVNTLSFNRGFGGFKYSF